MTSAEEQIGIAWWNNLSRQERMRVLVRAGEYKHDPSVADAYEMWRQGIISTESEPPNSELSSAAKADL